MFRTRLLMLCMGRVGNISSNVAATRAVLLAATSVLCIVGTACGFRPLYSEAGGANSKALASVSIAQINDRSGQKLRNFLLERMAPGTSGSKSLYTLKIKLRESKTSINIRKDQSATRANLLITADFILTPKLGNRGVFKGTVLSTNSYNVLDSGFATLSAEKDARNRALRSLAEEIRLRVGTALQNPSIFGKPDPSIRRRQ
jgi:LPS-assembly lipoprotein